MAKNESKEGNSNEDLKDPSLERLRLVVPAAVMLFGELVNTPHGGNWHQYSDFLRSAHDASTFFTWGTVVAAMAPVEENIAEGNHRSSWYYRLASKSTRVGLSFLGIAGSLKLGIYMHDSRGFEDPAVAATAAASFAVSHAYWFVYPWYRRRRGLYPNEIQR